LISVAFAYCARWSDSAWSRLREFWKSAVARASRSYSESRSARSLPSSSSPAAGALGSPSSSDSSGCVSLSSSIGIRLMIGLSFQSAIIKWQSAIFARGVNRPP
jgi:hypothetical protein